VAVFSSPTKQLILVEGPVEVSGVEGQAVDIAGGGLGIPEQWSCYRHRWRITLSSSVRGNGPVIKNGKGILSMSGINTLPGGVTLNAGKLRYFHPDAFGQCSLRVEGNSSLAPASANMAMGNPITIKAGARLLIESEAPEFTISGAVSGGGNLEKAGRGKLILAGAFDPAVRLTGTLGVLDFRPPQPVKLDATINGGLLRTAPGSLAEGSKLLISQAGALAASGARDGIQAWVESGWIARNRTAPWLRDGDQEIGGTVDMKAFFGKYPAMSLGSCGKTVLTGQLQLPGSLLRIGGGGGDIEIRTPLSGPLQLIIGAPSTTGNVTLSAPTPSLADSASTEELCAWGTRRRSPPGKLRWEIVSPLPIPASSTSIISTCPMR
jgi:autotransporter-associated beta strand protein